MSRCGCGLKKECRLKEQEESRLPQKYLFNPKIQAGRQGNTG